MKEKFHIYTMALMQLKKAIKVFLLAIISFFSIVFINNIALASGDIDLPPNETLDPGRIRQQILPPEAKDTRYTEPLLLEITTPREKKTIPLKTAIKKWLSSKLQQQQTVKFKLRHIVFQGGTLYRPQDLQKYTKPYIGKDVSLTNLNEITNAITARYRNDGYILARAVIPAQKVKDGVVQIKIIEGRIVKVYLEGEAPGAKTQLEKYAQKIQHMCPVKLKRLERYILLAKDLPGVTVKSTLSPSATTIDAAELTLTVTQKKASFYATYDNRASPYLGPQEVVTNLRIDDVFHHADSLLLQAVNTPNSDATRFLQLNYQIPLGSEGLYVAFNGNFTETHPGSIYSNLDLAGRSKNWSITLGYPLLYQRDANLDLYGKFDWMDTQSNYNEGAVFQDHIRSFRFGLNYDSVDQLSGINTANIELSKGLEILGASPDNPDTPLSRADGSSEYTKITASISRLQPLGRSRFSLFGLVRGQYSPGGLLSVEEFSFGGPFIGRGYDPAEIVADLGIAGKLELRVDTYPLRGALRRVQYYVFYDAGTVWDATSPDDQPQYGGSATSSGGGARVHFDKYFSMNLEIAKPLTRPVDSLVLTDENGKSWRLYFGTTISF